MKKIFSLTFIISVLLLTGCGSGSFFSTDKIKNETGLKEIPQQSDFPEADAIVLYELHDVNLKFTAGWGLQTFETTHRIVKLFKNIEKNSQEVIYLPEGESLEDISARTVKSDGTIIKLEKDDIFITSGVGDYDNFSNNKVVRFTYPAVEKNCTIELSYTIKDDYPFLFGGWGVQEDIPKIMNIYRLTLPTLLLLPEKSGGAGWDWKYVPVNLDLPRPEVNENMNPDKMIRSESETFEWKLSNIPAFIKEPKMPPERNYIQYVKFAPSEINSWADLTSRYYKNYFLPKLETEGIVKIKAVELTKDCKTDKDKINAIYKFVQKLRYISLNMNNQGIVPHSSTEVLAQECGDCKDKSTLLISMLKSIGIKAYPVLVQTVDEGELLESFPSWNFNHMMVKSIDSDNKSYWLDASSEYHTIGTLPPMDQGIKVVVIEGIGKVSLENTPESDASDNSINVNIDLKIDNNYEGNYKIDIRYDGEGNVEKRYFFKDKTDKEITQYCKSLLANDIVDAEFSNCKVKYIDSENPEVQLTFEVKSKDIVQIQGDLIFLNSDPFNVGTDMSWLNNEKRIYPVFFDYAYSINKKVNIQYPVGKMTLKPFPEDINLSIPGIFYEKSFSSKDENVIQINERVRIPIKTVSTKNYGGLKSTFEKINVKDKEKVMFNKK